MLTPIKMKTPTIQTLALAVLTALLAIAGTGSLKADSYGPYHPYTYGHNGYWDEHHAYHHWERYNNHDGYWYHRSDGARIFINI
jgi:hypothetical protein